MTKILHLDASGRHEGSLTRKLSAQTLEALKDNQTQVTYRDLVTSQLPLLNDTMIGAYFAKPDERNEVQKQAIAISDTLVSELQAHDTIVIGAPIYNFGMPAVLKAWADLVARAGVTFRYTENGPVGLLENKKAYIVTASGGTKVGSEIDFFTPWFKHFLGFIGIDNVGIIHADGLSRDTDAIIANAEAQIAALKTA